MRMILALLVMSSLVIASGASADQSTAPGQQKKAAGDGSAKEYAPGQQRAEEAESEAKAKTKEAQLKAKKKTEKAKKSGAGKSSSKSKTSSGTGAGGGANFYEFLRTKVKSISKSTSVIGGVMLNSL